MIINWLEAPNSTGLQVLYTEDTLSFVSTTFLYTLCGSSGSHDKGAASHYPASCTLESISGTAASLWSPKCQISCEPVCWSIPSQTDHQPNSTIWALCRLKALFGSKRDNKCQVRKDMHHMQHCIPTALRNLQNPINSTPRNTERSIEAISTARPKTRSQTQTVLRWMLRWLSSGSSHAMFLTILCSHLYTWIDHTRTRPNCTD